MNIAVRVLDFAFPYPANELEAFKISPRIGNVKNDDVALVEPIG